MFIPCTILYSTLFILAAVEAVPVASVDTSEELVETGFKQKAASAFSSEISSKFCGFGLMSHVVYFDPTSTEEDDRPIKIYSVLRIELEPTPENLINQLADALTVYNDMSRVSETGRSSSAFSEVGKQLTVRDDFLEGIKKIIFATNMVITTQGTSYQLGSYGCSDGPVTPQSIPDAYLYDSNNCIRGIVEAKSSAESPHIALRQGAAEAFNVAIMQLNMNVKWNEIMVFVIASNGFMLQVGVVYVLYPSFPAFVPLTCCLDMTNKDMRIQACHVMRCINKWIDDTKIIGNISRTTASSCEGKTTLSLQKYFIKKLNKFFSSKSNIQTSLHHFFEVMAWLHSYENCRSHIIFPICVREYDDIINETSIIFPRLNDYQIGLPIRDDLRRLYLDQLNQIILCIHHAGVVHLDLYPSNIMWKWDESNNGDLKLKIIDWDSCHYITEKPLQEVSNILLGREPLLLHYALQPDNLTSYDWAYYHILKSNINNITLQSNDKNILDAEFKALCNAITDTNDVHIAKIRRIDNN